MVEDDTSDEARDTVMGCNRKLYDLAQQLQEEAAQGRLGDKEKSTTFIL